MPLQNLSETYPQGTSWVRSAIVFISNFMEFRGSCPNGINSSYPCSAEKIVTIIIILKNNAMKPEK